MKSKKIPVDIKAKTVKEAQNEMKEIIMQLENADLNSEDSINKYNRIMQLNYHIQEQFRKKTKEIKQSIMDKNKKISSKKFK